MISRGTLKEGAYYAIDQQPHDDSFLDTAISDGALELIRRVMYQNARREWVLVRVRRSVNVPFSEWRAWTEVEGPDTRPEDTVPEEQLEESGIPGAEWAEEHILEPIQETAEEIAETVRKSLPTLKTAMLIGAGALTLLLLWKVKRR